jgi:hypothetical protein
MNGRQRRQQPSTLGSSPGRTCVPGHGAPVNVDTRRSARGSGGEVRRRIPPVLTRTRQQTGPGGSAAGQGGGVRGRRWISRTRFSFAPDPSSQRTSRSGVVAAKGVVSRRARGWYPPSCWPSAHGLPRAERDRVPRPARLVSPPPPDRRLADAKGNLNLVATGTRVHRSWRAFLNGSAWAFSNDLKGYGGDR